MNITTRLAELLDTLRGRHATRTPAARPARAFRVTTAPMARIGEPDGRAAELMRERRR